jgi:hypothetical protein
MILAIVCVGKSLNVDFEDMLIQIKRFESNGWDIHILTDKPELFSIGKTYMYENKIFSYVDKLLFTFRLMRNNKSDILYVDHNWLSNLNDNFVKEFKSDGSILFYDWWGTEWLGDGTYSPVWKRFIDKKLDYYNELYSYWDFINFDYSNIIVLRENCLYLPYMNFVDDIILEIEKIKPLLEYSTLRYSKGLCNRYGNGEGIALGLVIDKYKLKLNKIDKKYLNNE